MKIIEYSIHTGQYNMDFDAKLLEDSIKNNEQEPIFRLYGWKPSCVSLGRNQKDDFVDKDLLHSLKIDLVRRLTGGRALFHDKEITYSYVTPSGIIPNGENVSSSYEYISQILINIFAKLNIELTIGGCSRNISKNNYCMSISTGADLCWRGKKFIGSAQCRRNGYILQHGSILLDYDKDLLNKIFNENTDFSHIVSLKEIDSSITIDDILNVIN